MSKSSVLVLASASPVRSWLLKNAGLIFEIDAAEIDESEIKKDCHAAAMTAEDVATTIAEAKALAVSRRRPDAWVIGADQVLVFEGTIFDKPMDVEEAVSHLRRFRGRSHDLVSAVCVAFGSRSRWLYSEAVTLHVRDFSNAFLDTYIADAGEGILASVGAYRLEGLGAQLFSRIEGDYFAVLGLPLLPLLNFLRDREVIAT